MLKKSNLVKYSTAQFNEVCTSKMQHNSQHYPSKRIRKDMLKNDKTAAITFFLEQMNDNF